jgi:hypothetical protein
MEGAVMDWFPEPGARLMVKRTSLLLLLPQLLLLFLMVILLLLGSRLLGSTPGTLQQGFKQLQSVKALLRCCESQH